MIVRPYGIIQSGCLQLGLEILMHGNQISEVRPHTGIPENFVVSPAFVNAHSHLEYRGMQGKLQSEEYWSWIHEITELKKDESDVRVRQETIAAAHENRKTGVAILAEHSDRPFAATAMLSAGLDGVIFQETITALDRQSRHDKLAQVRAKAMAQAKLWRKPIFLTPHAYHTVDQDTLLEFGASGEPISIHAAESAYESMFTRDGKGFIGDYCRQGGIDYKPHGKGIIQTLNDMGLVRPETQLVHCCDLSSEDVGLIATKGAAVAHCPRSNQRLKCPIAPVRELLDAGVQVGLGMDSPASSGQIDMFAEMKSALGASASRGKCLTPEEVWRMATEMGACSLEFARLGLPTWRIEPNSSVPLIKIAVPGATTTEDLIQRGSPAKVSWV